MEARRDCIPGSTFDQVVEALKSERAYQDSIWKELDAQNSLQDYKQYMQNYLDKITNFTDSAKVTEIIRKVAAIGVKAMEKFGVQPR